MIENVHEIASQNIKEIVLTGINLGDFGKNKNKEFNSTFLDLIKELDNLDLDLRFRISSIEPNLLNDEIISFISTSKKFVHHFHIPLQSGSDSILRLMRRRYDSKLYKSRIEKINKLMPDACIGVDVIVGFPGENDDLFLESLDFLDSLNVSYFHVFTYSERDNTHAISLPNIVEPNVRTKRSKLLRLLSSKKKASFYERNRGSIQDVLFESEKKMDT